MIENKFPPIQNPPLSGEVLSEKTVLSTVDIYKSFNQNIQPLPTSTMPDEITKAMLCQTNCSGNGECRDGSCYCMVSLSKLFKASFDNDAEFKKMCISKHFITSNYYIFTDPV